MSKVLGFARELQSHSYNMDSTVAFRTLGLPTREYMKRILTYFQRCAFCLKFDDVSPFSEQHTIESVSFIKR